MKTDVTSIFDYCVIVINNPSNPGPLVMKSSKDLNPHLDGDGDLLTKLLDDADRVFIKKLSNNDRDWASKPGKHQAGPYIPMVQAVRGFFPQLERKARKPVDMAASRRAQIQYTPRELFEQGRGNAYDTPSPDAFREPASCILSRDGKG
jgi:hypothetical protein